MTCSRATPLPSTAGVTVNAAGARAGTIMQAFGVSRRVPLLKAMNLVTVAAGERHRAGRTDGDGTDADARSLAGPRDHRDRPVEDAGRARRRGRDGERSRGVHRRGQPGVPGASPHARRRDARPSRHRSRRGGSAGCARSPLDSDRLRPRRRQRRRRHDRHRGQVHDRATRGADRHRARREAPRQAARAVANGDDGPPGRGHRRSRSAGDRNGARGQPRAADGHHPPPHRPLRRTRRGTSCA